MFLEAKAKFAEEHNLNLRKKKGVLLNYIIN
jgi:hypothetical protein